MKKDCKMIAYYGKPLYVCKIIETLTAERHKTKNMKELKTINGKTIVIISSNKRMRTYTIKADGRTYRTIPFCREKFIDAQRWTGDDWNNFISSTLDYYTLR